MAKHVISLQEAVEMTKKFRKDKNRILKDEFQNSDVLPVCETFDVDEVKKLVNRERVKSFRIYYGMDADLNLHSILVGADEQGNDILPSASHPASLRLDDGPEGNGENDGDDDDDILERGLRCPPSCPPSSPLNED